MKTTLKSAVCGALAVALGVLTIAGLSAPLLSLGKGFSENGFDLMRLMSPYFFGTDRLDYRIMTAIIGLLCNFQCTYAFYIRTFCAFQLGKRYCFRSVLVIVCKSYPVVIHIDRIDKTVYQSLFSFLCG